MFERARKRRSTRKQESSDGSDYEDHHRHRNDFNITNSSSGDDDVEYRPRVTDRGESSSSGRKRARHESEPQGQFTHYILETRINIEHGLKSVERTVERALRSNGLSEDAKTVCEINDSIVRRKLNKLRDYCSQIPRNAPNENYQSMHDQKSLLILSAEPENITSPLVTAILCGNVDALNIILGSLRVSAYLETVYLEFKSMGRFQLSPLHVLPIMYLAVAGGHLNVVMELHVRYKLRICNIKCCSYDLLGFAAFANKLDIFEWLLENGSSFKYLVNVHWSIDEIATFCILRDLYISCLSRAPEFLIALVRSHHFFEIMRIVIPREMTIISNSTSEVLRVGCLMKAYLEGMNKLPLQIVSHDGVKWLLDCAAAIVEDRPQPKYVHDKVLLCF